MTAPTEEPLLRVEDLRVEFPTEDGVVHAVDGISYDVRAGGTLGIVGESGSGKTVAALTRMGLTRRANARITGRILFEGRDLLALSEEEMRTLRGNEIAMVFQDPLSSLHPLYTVGAQIVEAIRAHRDVPKARSRARAIELLDLVGIREPDRRVDRVPARTVWRHAPARDDRDGARQRAEAADRRRADDRARRDRAGADPRAARASAARAVDGDRGRHARSRRGRGDRRGRRGHVRGADRRARSRRAVARRPEHPYTWGLLRSIPTLAGPRATSLGANPGQPAEPDRAPLRMSLPPALPLRPARPRPHRPPPGALPRRVRSPRRVPARAGVRRDLWAQLRAGGTPAQALSAVTAGVPEASV